MGSTQAGKWNGEAVLTVEKIFRGKRRKTRRHEIGFLSKVCQAHEEDTRGAREKR